MIVETFSIKPIFSAEHFSATIGYRARFETLRMHEIVYFRGMWYYELSSEVYHYRTVILVHARPTATPTSQR